jgi:hypothetical protein
VVDVTLELRPAGKSQALERTKIVLQGHALLSALCVTFYIVRIGTGTGGKDRIGWVNPKGRIPEPERIVRVRIRFSSGHPPWVLRKN